MLVWDLASLADGEEPVITGYLRRKRAYIDHFYLRIEDVTGAVYVRFTFDTEARRTAIRRLEEGLQVRVTGHSEEAETTTSRSPAVGTQSRSSGLRRVSAASTPAWRSMRRASFSHRSRSSAVECSRRLDSPGSRLDWFPPPGTAT